MTRQRTMRRYTGLARRYLGQQRKRTILTIVAVVLSVALITSAGVFAQSIRELGVENVRERFGGFYGRLSNRSAEEVDRLRLHAAVAKAGSLINVGTVSLTPELTVTMIAPDNQWIEMQGLALSAGRFPSQPGEVAVERWIFQAARRPVSVGDVVNLPVHPATRERSAAEGSTGQEAPGGTPVPAGTEVPAQRELTVVGFLDPSSGAVASGTSTAVVTQSEAAAILPGALRFSVAFTTRGELDPQEAIASVARSFGLEPNEVHQNTALLTAMGEGRVRQANDALRAIELIVALTLVVATVAVIYNSFTISVIERIRQFGIIRTVGATPRQIRRIVLRQAAVIAAVGSPLGVGAGLVAVRLVVLVFNTLPTDIGFAGVSMSYPPFVLVGAPILGVLSVYASALLPARMAGRVSPLEAVLAEGRFVKDRVRHRRSVLLRRLFGVAGRLASQNLRRHPGRFALTVFSIGIGVALFVTFAGFFSLMSSATENIGTQDVRGDITVTVRGTDPAPIGIDGRAAVEGLPGVASVIGVYEIDGAVGLPEEGFEDAGDRVGPELADRARRMAGTAGPVFPVSLLGLDPDALSEIRSAVIDGWRTPSGLTELGGVYVRDGLYRPGDMLRFVLDDRLVELPVAGVADSLPVGNENSLTLVTTVDVARRIAGSGGYTGLEVFVDSDADRDGMIRAIEAVLGNRQDVFAFDMGSVAESGEQINLQMSILLYGMVAVVGLIGALNIVNTITTNLVLRIREFGMLRAVGMSGLQMRGMIRIEAVLYGAWAVVGGGAVGVGLIRLMFRNVIELQAIPWQFPWASLLASAVVAVGLCLLSAAVPMKRIADMNIVESIQHE